MKSAEPFPEFRYQEPKKPAVREDFGANSTIVIREYETNDRDQCIRLISEVLDKDSGESLFFWRYETERRVKPILVCAFDRDRLVSVNSWLPWVFCYENETYLGYQSGDSATVPDYRGKGIFGRLLSLGESIAIERGGDFLFGFPGEMSRGSFRRAGYKTVARYFYYLRPVNPFARRPRHVANARDNEVFVDRGSGIVPKVDAEYTNWRFLSHPKSYVLLRYEEQDAQAVFAMSENGSHKMHGMLLLDCRLGSLDPTFVSAAFSHLDGICARRTTCIRTSFNEFAERGKALRSLFPIRIPSRYDDLIVKVLSKRTDPGAFLDPGAWDIMPHCVDWR